jgi:hypothetical protein
MAYEYGQPLSLYAPVINGKQVIAVVFDFYSHGNQHHHQKCTDLTFLDMNRFSKCTRTTKGVDTRTALFVRLTARVP